MIDKFELYKNAQKRVASNEIKLISVSDIKSVVVAMEQYCLRLELKRNMVGTLYKSIVIDELCEINKIISDFGSTQRHR